MAQAPSIKICGITSVADARMAAELDADAIGVNFWARSKRRCELDEAARIVEAVDVRVVAVFVDATIEEIERARAETGIRWAQLHGDEAPSALDALLPHAYKAIRPASEDDVEAALRWAGDEILIDANVAGVPGGTGQLAHWEIAARIARERNVWLAGGLNADNVAEAIAAVHPYGVDVASGVERAPGIKDRALVERFIRSVRASVVP